MKFVGMAFAAAMMAALPATAQNSDQPVDVTAAPPPSPDSVGPAQLRDFSLGGNTSRPAQPAQTTTEPPATPPASSAAPASPRPSAATTTSADRPAPVQAAPSNGGRRATRTQQPVAPPAAEVAQPFSPAETAGVEPAPVEPDVVDLAVPATADRLAMWPWLAAFAALVAGAGLFWWNRRSRQQRAADPGRLAFAGVGREEVETSPSPRVVSSPPPPEPEPEPEPAPAPPPVAAPRNDGLITSSALKPALTIKLRPERLVLTASDITLHFDLAIENVGAGPARDVLIEALMVTASVRQDQEIAEFFQKPQSQGDRIPVIAPLDTLPLKSVVRLPIDRVQHFEAGGRVLFVPLIAFNLAYRAGAEDRQNSASFMIGRGNDGDEKLAPFRLDLGPRIFRELSVRAHSAGLSS